MQSVDSQRRRGGDAGQAHFCVGERSGTLSCVVGVLLSVCRDQLQINCDHDLRRGILKLTAPPVHHWLKFMVHMFAVADGEQWNSLIYAGGGYRADFRMEMGKKAAAHNWQQTTTLIAAILNTVSATESWVDTLQICGWQPAGANSERTTREQSRWSTTRTTSS